MRGQHVPGRVAPRPSDGDPAPAAPGERRCRQGRPRRYEGFPENWHDVSLNAQPVLYDRDHLILHPSRAVPLRLDLPLVSAIGNYTAGHRAATRAECVTDAPKE